MNNRIIVLTASAFISFGMADHSFAVSDNFLMPLEKPAIVADLPLKQLAVSNTVVPSVIAEVKAVHILPFSQIDTQQGIRIPAQARTVIENEENNDSKSTQNNKTSFSTAPIQLLKRAAMDKDCDGIADQDYSQTTITPGNGECLSWSLTVENNSSDTFCSIEVNDSAPLGFADLSIEPFILEQPEPGTGTCDVEGNSFSCTVGNSIDMNADNTEESSCLRAGETAEIRYSIRMNDIDTSQGSTNP